MRLVLCFCIFITTFVHSQYDTLFLEFQSDKDSFPDCENIYAANGQYVFPTTDEFNLQFSGFVFINPRELNINKRMTIYSQGFQSSENQYFEKPTHYLKELDYNTVLGQYFIEKDSSIFLSQKNYFNRLGYLVNHEKVDDFVDNYTIEERKEREDSINAFSKRNFELNGGPINVPTEGIIDGYYIAERVHIYKPMDYFEAHPLTHDSVRKAHDKFKNEVMRPILDSVLRPFYLSESEVTNLEYKMFVKYVKDSITLHMAYLNADNNQALLLLNTSRKIRKTLKSENKSDNLKRFGLKFPKKEFYDDLDWIPFITDMYLPQPSRYFAKRQIDVSKLIYHLNDSLKVKIYPDTLGFNKLNNFSMSPLINMYFWHPAYDNYPVLNLSEKQMIAFCDWKEKKVNQQLNLVNQRIEVSIPTITQYEFALKKGLIVKTNEAHDQVNTNFIVYERPEEASMHYLMKVNQSTDDVPFPYFDYNRWYGNGGSFYNLSGNASEVVSDNLTTQLLEYNGLYSNLDKANYRISIGDNYLIGVKTKDDYQFNSLFYKRLIPKDSSDCLTGFRLVYMVKKK